MKKKILVVDDEEMIREFLALEITHAGYEVISAGSGNEAIKILRTVKVDTIISDFQMPDGNGLVVLNYAKTLNNCPRFFFTSADSSFMKDELANHFIDRIFTKPFLINEILAALNEER